MRLSLAVSDVKESSRWYIRDSQSRGKCVVCCHIAHHDALAWVEIVFFDKVNPHSALWLATVTADRWNAVRAKLIVNENTQLVVGLFETGFCLVKR